MISRSLRILRPFLSAAVTCFVTTTLLCPAPVARAQSRYGVPAQVEVPAAPVPFRARGKRHLVYELHVTNFRAPALTLLRVDVFGGTRAGRPLGSYAGKELSDNLARPGLAPDATDRAVIGGGLRAILFIWVTLEDSVPAPTSLHHRLTFRAPDSEKELVLDVPRVDVRRDRPPVLGPPLGEGMWVAARGPSNVSGHRRALIPTEGRAYIAQRFAVDLMRVGPDRRVMPEDHGSRNESWYGYGAEVFAVAGGVVAAVKDGLPDNVPLSPDRAVPVTSETVGGNYVMLKLAGGWYAFYAHLKPNSIRVKVGERVRNGQVLGLLGNSGNSDAPHLHLHVASAPSPLGAEGLPYLFTSYAVLGIEAFDPRKKSPGDRRTLELPLENELIRFR